MIWWRWGRQTIYRSLFFLISFHQVRLSESLSFCYTLYGLVRMHGEHPEGKTADISTISTEGISCLWEQTTEFHIKDSKAGQWKMLMDRKIGWVLFVSLFLNYLLLLMITRTSEPLKVREPSHKCPIRHSNFFALQLFPISDALAATDHFYWNSHTPQEEHSFLRTAWLLKLLV